MRAFKKENPAIYIQMQGVDEFHVTGNFKNWEFWDSLPDIHVPVLVIGGMFDEMNPEDIKKGRSSYSQQQNLFMSKRQPTRACMTIS